MTLRASEFKALQDIYLKAYLQRGRGALFERLIKRGLVSQVGAWDELALTEAGDKARKDYIDRQGSK